MPNTRQVSHLIQKLCHCKTLELQYNPVGLRTNSCIYHNLAQRHFLIRRSRGAAITRPIFKVRRRLIVSASKTWKPQHNKDYR
jgi:hypothetical protein